MRKYILPLLGLYLDFICINAAIGLAVYFVGLANEELIGTPPPWGAQMLASLLVLSVLRLLHFSIGEWLLAYAVAEREADIVNRQWPNLVLGTIGLLSGLKEAVRWTLPGDGMPFLFMVDETPAKVAAVFTFGLLYIAGGAMLLRFAPGAKLFNGILLTFGAVMMAVNLLFFRDAMVAAQVERRLSQGLAPDIEAAEAVVSMAPVYGGVVFALLYLLLYFCRARRVRYLSPNH